MFKATLLLPYVLSAMVRHESSCLVSYCFKSAKAPEPLMFAALHRRPKHTVSSYLLLSVAIMCFDVTVFFSPHASYLEDSYLGLMLSFLVICV